VLQSLHAGQVASNPPSQPLRVVITPVAALSLIGANDIVIAVFAQIVVSAVDEAQNDIVITV
jgi:hypothetical protein